MSDLDNEKRSERWHLGKEIPIAVVFGFVVQTLGLVWFAATQTAELGNVVTMMKDFRASQYTIADARRDQELHIGRSTNNSRRIDELMRRVERIEGGRNQRDAQQ